MKAWPALLLIAVAAACWVVTANRMVGMDMGPGTDLGGIGWFAGVWVTMMAAMMLPSLVPMGLASARAPGTTALGWSRSTTAVVLFAVGYLLTWLAAGLVAYSLIQGVRSLDPGFLAWGEAGPYLAGGVIVGAALYELTAVKATCLRRCRDPQQLIERRRSGRLGMLQIGVEHGGYCVGCCWALMAALFALGVMSIAWMAVITAVIATEKLLPWAALAVGTTTVVLVALGIGVALAPSGVPGLTIPG